MLFTPQNLRLGFGKLLRPLALPTSGGGVRMIAPETQDARIARPGPPILRPGLGGGGDIGLGRSRFRSLDQSADQDLSVFLDLGEFLLEDMHVFQLFPKVFERGDIFVPFGFRGVPVDAVIVVTVVLVHGSFEAGMLDGTTDRVGDTRGRGHIGQQGGGGRVGVGQEGEERGGELFLRRTVEG